MITEREGDIFAQDDLRFILHCANRHCVMGSGVAAQVVKQRPSAHMVDLATADESDTPVHKSQKLGRFTSGADTVKGTSRITVNLYGQIGIGANGRPNRWDRNTSYDAIYDALRSFKRTYELRDVDKRWPIGIPYGMAADRAGGKWVIIRAMIESLFGDTDYEVAIVRFPGMRDLD